MTKQSLDLAIIGNGQIGALIDGEGEIVWCCLPSFDGDPVFCSLLNGHAYGEGIGYCSVELIDCIDRNQNYLDNSAVLVTRMTDCHGGVIELTDFAPRFRQFGRIFSPMMLIREIKQISGNPRIQIRIRPSHSYGSKRCNTTRGSHHIRYTTPDWVMRLTTDISLTAILDERPVFLENKATLVFGDDETITESVAELSRRFKNETLGYWQNWVRDLGIPFEWQDEVIRAAITLKLNAFEDTGAIVAAMTTSIPESPGTFRNWDYRYCWLRDAYFVVNALNRLGTTHTMEKYLGFLINLVAGGLEGHIQPVYGIDGKSQLEERVVDSLPGYRDIGPVRIGNQAYEQVQHDVYGSAILAVAHVFFDRRLVRRGDQTLFKKLEPLGYAAVSSYDKPDAGLWELRSTLRIHTFSSVMCWAACDRLAKIAYQLGLEERGDHWRTHADHIHSIICTESWNIDKQAFVASFGGDSLDASMLLLHDIGFLEAGDPRFAMTVSAIERELKQGDYIYRYVEADDFGIPENAFLVCTFWYIYALVALDRNTEARELFEKLLSRRNSLGLLAEHIDPQTGEQWGNFVQTYSMVGLINCAIRLSRRWDNAF